MNSSALRKRLKSPVSATNASAVRVSTPRRRRSLATSSRHGPCSATSAIAPLQLLDPAVDEIERVHLRVERLLPTELREAVPVTHPVEARILAGAYQVAGGFQLRRGTWIGSSGPPASSRASLRASRGSVFTRFA